MSQGVSISLCPSCCWWTLQTDLSRFSSVHCYQGTAYSVSLLLGNTRMGNTMKTLHQFGSQINLVHFPTWNKRSNFVLVLLEKRNTVIPSSAASFRLGSPRTVVEANVNNCPDCVHYWPSVFQSVFQSLLVVTGCLHDAVTTTKLRPNRRWRGCKIVFLRRFAEVTEIKCLHDAITTKRRDQAKTKTLT
jgi:hypothetical protein